MTTPQITDPPNNTPARTMDQETFNTSVTGWLNWFKVFVPQLGAALTWFSNTASDVEANAAVAATAAGLPGPGLAQITSLSGLTLSGGDFLKWENGGWVVQTKAQIVDQASVRNHIPESYIRNHVPQSYIRDHVPQTYISDQIAGSAVDGIGAFVFAFHQAGNGTTLLGDVVAGSSLQPGNSSGNPSSATLPGSWVCCGHASTGSTAENATTLFKRIL